MLAPERLKFKIFDDPNELRADMAAKLCAETPLPEMRLAIHNRRKESFRNAAQTEKDFISLPFSGNTPQLAQTLTFFALGNKEDRT